MTRKRKPIAFGKYTLIERINVGGMAEVFKAMETRLAPNGHLFAIKRILPTMAEDDDFIKMFVDEASIACRLQHPNVCRLYELGTVDEAHFISMEFIHGKDLLQVQNKFRKSKQIMPVNMSAYVCMKAAEGLDYAHRYVKEDGQSLGIIHRDVSPQNILVSYSGDVKVIDFGIAKAQDRQTKTQAGILKGKFGYMSPEQVMGKKIDHRSDVFAIGTVLYEMLSGERLFVGESDFSTLEKVRNVDILPPRHYNDKVPEALEKIVLKALAKDRDERYAWASDLAADIATFLKTQVPFDGRRLSAWMKAAFSEELAKDTEKLNEFKQGVADGSIVLEIGESDPEPVPEPAQLEEGALKTEIFDPSMMSFEGESDSDDEEEVDASAGKTEIFDPSQLEGFSLSEEKPVDEIISATATTPSVPAIEIPEEPEPVRPVASPSVPQSQVSQGALGQSLSTASVPTVRPQETRPKPKKQAKNSLFRDIMLGIGLAVFVVALVAVYFVLKSPKTTDTAQNAQAASAVVGLVRITDPKGATATITSAVSDKGAPIEKEKLPTCLTTPCELGNLPLGDYTLLISQAEFESHEEKIRVTSAQPIPVSVQLKPKSPGKLRLVSIGKDKYAKFKGQIELALNGSVLPLSNEGMVDVPSGKQQIEIRRQGYMTLAREYTIPANAIFDITLDTADFTPITFTLHVDTIPAGRVLLDGVDKGMAPIDIPGLLAPQLYTVTVKSEGFEDAIRTVKWKEGATFVLQVNLSKTNPSGYLVATTIPFSVSVLVDGKKTGFQTPVKEPGIKLSPGTHEIRFVSAAGKEFGPYEITVSEGQTIRKLFNLTGTQ